MKASFDLLFATRQLLQKTIGGLSLNQINTVPESYNNSVGWNVAHIVVTQQLLHYPLSNNAPLIPDALIDRYRKGTKAELEISEDDWEMIKEFLVALPLQLKKDFYSNKFTEFKQYPTSYGYELNSIEEAIQFNNLHEALHLGYIMGMKKLV